MHSHDGSAEVTDNPAAHRFELKIDGRLMGRAEYQLAGDHIVFTHTEVDPALRGHGYGHRLAEAAITSARERGFEISATCWFMVRELADGTASSGA